MFSPPNLKPENLDVLAAFLIISVLIVVQVARRRII